MQHGSGITKPGHAFILNLMGIQPRCLRRDVCSQAKQTSARLIHHLEGTQIKISSLINHE